MPPTSRTCPSLSKRHGVPGAARRRDRRVAQDARRGVVDLGEPVHEQHAAVRATPMPPRSPLRRAAPTKKQERASSLPPLPERPMGLSAVPERTCRALQSRLSASVPPRSELTAGAFDPRVVVLPAMPLPGLSFGFVVVLAARRSVREPAARRFDRHRGGSRVSVGGQTAAETSSGGTTAATPGSIASTTAGSSSAPENSTRIARISLPSV